MARANQSGEESADLDLVVALMGTLAAIVTSALSVSGSASAVVELPFLLFIPGYAVTVALFPRRQPSTARPEGAEDDGLPAFERVVIAVATSIALAVLVGIGLEYTPLAIRIGPIVWVLSGLTIVALGVAYVRRDETGHRPASRLTVPDDISTVATLFVVLAVATALITVGVVGGTDRRGERYTEFALLTENDAGDLVATDHPSELTVGEPTTLHYRLTNKEQRPVEYRVIVRLSVIGADGEVVRETRLDSFRERLAPGESVRRPHDVTPTMTGDDLRLTYLLYRSEPPADPSPTNAYRDLHLWVDVDATSTQT